MSERVTTDNESSLPQDDLALYVDEIEVAFAERDFTRLLDLIDSDLAAAWYGLPPSRIADMLQFLLRNVSTDNRVLQAAQSFFTDRSVNPYDSPEFLSTFEVDDPREMFILTMLRLANARRQGRIREGLEYCDVIERLISRMPPLVGSHNGWALLTTVQLGITAMLAGDFTRALTYFTRAQLQVPVPKFAFLTRDALTKSALIHACFGNRTTARSLLHRADKVARTSSWAETHIDAHRDFAASLATTEDYEEALQKLENINVREIGEMWPFYVLAVQRTLDAAGHQDELGHKIQMFQTMPLPRNDRDGLAGSIIPLKRATMAMKNGRSAEAQAFLDRADQRIPYTQLFQAAAHVYAGRTAQAIQAASRLRPETRGFRLLEARRLAILAAAQYQAEERDDCVATLSRAANMPRGLQRLEVQLFSPETRKLAATKVPHWPRDHEAPSIFLTSLPKPGVALTEREIEILSHLAQGRTRAQLAAEIFISVNTLKTHLKAIYRKLGVSTAADAVLHAQRRGLL